MDILTKDDLKNLMEKRDFSCISIYMPTHRTSLGAKQDRIRLKNLLKKMEQRLIACGLRRSKAEVLSAYGKALVKDLLFWQYQSDGFAAFISSELFRYYRLPVSFEELLVVTDRFHIKPLLRLFADNGQFYVLALSRNQVKLFLCSRYSITEVQLENIPASLGEALKYDEPARQLQFHTKTPGGRGERAAIFHGHGAGKEEDKNNVLRFFQQIDQGLQKILRGDRAPLVLAGVDYLLPIYHEANSYSRLLDQGIPGNPESLRPEVLQKGAWTIVEPYFLKAREEGIARYRELLGSRSASGDVKTITLAAYEGRVEVLFAAVGVQQWGTFYPDSVQLHEGQEPGDEDLLDFAAVHTLLNGGTVHAVKAEELPDRLPLAAILRY
jgi:hypothetical protein